MSARVNIRISIENVRRSARRTATGRRCAFSLPVVAALMKASICRDDKHRNISTLPVRSLERRRFGRWALAYSGWASAIDSVLAQAVRGHDVAELLNYMNRFAADVS
jgi:hypothetical protein